MHPYLEITPTYLGVTFGLNSETFYSTPELLSHYCANHWATPHVNSGVPESRLTWNAQVSLPYLAKLLDPTQAPSK